MNWDGKERRGDNLEDIHEMRIDIAEIRKDVKALDVRINGSINDFTTHIKHGEKWRVTIATIGVGLIMNVIVFAYMFGQLSTTVRVNTRIIEKFANKYVHIDTDKAE